MDDNSDKIDELGSKISKKMLDVFLRNSRNAPAMNALNFVDFHMKIISVITLTLISGLRFNLNREGNEIDIIQILDMLNNELKDRYKTYEEITNNKFAHIELHVTNTIN
jgi:hypothetical protein